MRDFVFGFRKRKQQRRIEAIRNAEQQDKDEKGRERHEKKEEARLKYNANCAIPITPHYSYSIPEIHHSAAPVGLEEQGNDNTANSEDEDENEEQVLHFDDGVDVSISPLFLRGEDSVAKNENDSWSNDRRSSNYSGNALPAWADSVRADIRRQEKSKKATTGQKAKAMAKLSKKKVPYGRKPKRKRTKGDKSGGKRKK